MLLALRIDTSTFQRKIDVAFSTVQWQFALVYFDNIFYLLSLCSKEHVDHIKQVLTLLRDARATLKLKKCSSLSETINFLGSIIRSTRLEISSHTTVAVKRLKVPRNVIDLKMVLGICSVFKRFLQNFARIASQLNNKLKEKQQFNLVLNEKELPAIKCLQLELISAPVLALTYAEGRMTLDTDASEVRVGNVLLQ